MLSLGVAFAADENVTLNEVDDGITVDKDVLSVEKNSDTLSVSDENAIEADDSSNLVGASSTVTNDTFFDYFDSSGALTSDADELIFEGNFSDLPISQIMIAGNHPVKFTGNDATFTNVQFLIMQSDVTINGFNFVYNDGDGKLFYIVGENVLDNITISNNNIDFSAVKDYDSYAIFAGADLSLDSNAVTNLSILNNIFRYVGNTNGTTINNVIRVVGYEGYVDWNTWDEIPPKASSDILVVGNSFDIDIPSIARGYDGSRDETILYTAGMEFYYCSDLEIRNNRINLKYISNDGMYDTIDIIDVRGHPYNMDFFGEIVCEDIIVANNTINALGHNYTYGMSISAEGIEIYDNTVNITSDGYQASGICVEAPSNDAVVRNNTVTLNAGFVTYGIYSFENEYSGAIDIISVINNTIYGDAYATCGINLVGSDMIVSDNTITSLGNNTFGIALSGLRIGATIDNNIINCLGSNVGMKDTGDRYIPANSSKAISISGLVNVTKNKIFSTDIGISAIIEGKMLFDNNTIVVNANNGKVDNFAIVAEDIDDLKIINNNVTYSGLVDYQFVIVGYDYTYGYPNPIYDTSNNTRAYGVYVKNSNVVIRNNDFEIAIPTFAVNWGLTRESFSEGIVLVGCDDLEFINNNVTVTTNGGSSWDTVYGIDVLNSANPAVKNNNITLDGKGYAYGLIINDQNFDISENTIIVTSDNYACGIDVEGTANGNITKNTISATGVDSAYPIYSGMNYMPVSVDIVDNKISGEAYYVVGVEVGGDKVLLENNDISVKGNHTIGVGAYLEEIVINKNNITSDASNVGNVPIWDNFGTDTSGIKIAKGNFTISNNDIETTGDYAVNSGDASGNITNNELLSSNGEGDSSIIGLGDVNSTGNPATHNKYLKVIMFANDLTKVYGSADQFIAKVLDENGQPVYNKTITFVLSTGETFTATTDADGFAKLDIDLVKGEYLITSRFAGDSEYGAKSITSNIVVNAKPTALTAPDASVLLTAVKKGYTYKITLKDNSGNVLANKDVTINGKAFTTDKNGVINYKVSASKAGTQKLTVKFAGDDKYAASTKTATIKITKEATKLTAKKATFKAKKKSKKYTVTLKDSKGKGIKGVKVTIKVGKKTYSAKTKANGKATFNLKKLSKKGKYTANINYAGDNTYKSVSKSAKITIN